MLTLLKRIFGTAQTRTLAAFSSLLRQVRTFEDSYLSLTDDQLRAKTAEFRERIQKGESVDKLLPEAYAVVISACRRLLGQEFHVSGYNQRWDMIPYDVQILGAIALHKGYIAEMQTGEGKTLTGTLPLYLNALTGKPVHIVTVNDYLAKRDCEWVGTIYRWLGLTTGVISGDHYAQRRQAYGCDIVFGTASEFGFDYLRDNSMATRADEQVQRGHYFALIDEVDSILIDEARTPLIISGPATTSRQLYDILQNPVQTLVSKQRELCHNLALTAQKQLSPHADNEAEKELSEADKEALRTLWLVSKGTPRNRVLKRIKEDPDFRAALDSWDLYYYSEQNKEAKATALSELYMIVDEKANEYELTDRGIGLWQQCGGHEDDFVMLDLGHEFACIDQDAQLSDDDKLTARLKLQEQDELRKERAHNLRQLLRAHLLMERDVDYIVQDNKVIIIDENTGRAQPGRRFSDGLHQAIEAKERVPIQRETQTMATITLQNYFRLYKKLAGMTGTAITEAQEFKEIYKIDVLQIPPNKPCTRSDANDEMYMTEREKYNALLAEVKKIHGEGRPILLGTESVEISEKLSRIFGLNKLQHTVLNAKNNEREAEIIAQAGQHSAITIATNMAGRGTDIKLGEGIATLGGLHVIGSTRHQSRRIDRQLRGRCGRQGDPGSSKFYISLEDPLMRLFSSPTITALLKRFRPPEGEPIAAKMLNRSIETAQKRIEQRNYMMRKHTLEYDDVMNKQRQEIYAYRQELLHTPNVPELAYELFEVVCEQEAARFLVKRGSQWDVAAFCEALMQAFPVTLQFDDDHASADALAHKADEVVKAAFRHKLESEARKAVTFSNNPEFDPQSVINNALRHILLETIDHYWQEHLLAMDHLRSDVHLRVVGQKDPLMEFKHESFRLFATFSRALKSHMAQAIFRFEIVTRRPSQPNLEAVLDRMLLETNRSFVDDEEAPAAAEPEVSDAPVVAGPRIGRNDPCPCGSGKKYKQCCGQQAGA